MSSNRKPWTWSEDELMRWLYPHFPSKEVAELLNRSLVSVYGRSHILGVSKSPAFFLTEASGRLDGLRGASCRFVKGQVSWNKGKRIPATENHYTFFKKGQLPHNTLHDGAIRTRVQKGKAYQYVRVAQGKWELLHREVWRKNFGEIPKGMNVRFKDGNSLNCRIDNLKLISKSQNMISNSIQRYPQELQEVMKLNKKLTRRIGKIIDN